MRTNVAGPACDKDALCVAINLRIDFFSRFGRTLSGSEVTAACEPDGSPFARAILRV
jgi:hypothetical protein